MESQNQGRFVQCQSCGMFRLFKQFAYNQLLQQYPTINNSPPKVTCFNCNEKIALLDQINDLNTVIETLHERIDSLTQIRSHESEIDDLSAQLATVQLGDITIPPDTGAEVTLCSSAVSISNGMNDTSIWSNLDTDQSQCNSTHHSGPSHQNDHPTTVDRILQSVRNKSASVAQTHGVHGQEIPLISNVIKENTSYKQEEAIAKFRQNDTVTTLLCGGRELTGVTIDSRILKSKEGFKITNPNASLNEMVKTAKFFIDKNHKNVKSMIFQISTNHIENGKSEIIKDTLTKFSSEMTEKGIKVVVSGPIPYNVLNGECFSRLCALTDWLLKHSSTCSTFNIIDNSDFFQNNSLFTERRGKLNTAGVFTLQERITRALVNIRAD